MLRAAGNSSSTESPNSMSGLSDFQILDKLIGGAERDAASVIDSYLVCLESTLQPGMVDLFPQATRALVELARVGFENYLVTGNHPSGARIKLKAAGFSSHFEPLRVFGSSPERRDRYSISLFAIQELGLKRVIFVGDSLNDVETARAHGLPCVAVATGHHSERELSQAGADITLGQGYDWKQLVEAAQSLSGSKFL